MYNDFIIKDFWNCISDKVHVYFEQFINKLLTIFRFLEKDA